MQSLFFQCPATRCKWQRVCILYVSDLALGQFALNMLDVATKFLISELNTYLLARTDSDAVTVEFCKVVDDAGKWAIPEDHVGVSIIHIEEDRTFKAQLPATTLVNGQHVVLEPEVKVNLHLLFSANFKTYEQAIKYISLVLTFFQARTVFSQDAYPNLDPRIYKLTAELQTLNYEQLNQVWAFVGAKQLPSVIYKVRLVVIQDIDQPSIGRPIVEISTDLHQR